MKTSVRLILALICTFAALPVSAYGLATGQGVLGMLGALILLVLAMLLSAENENDALEHAIGRRIFTGKLN